MPSFSIARFNFVIHLLFFVFAVVSASLKRWTCHNNVWVLLYVNVIMVIRNELCKSFLQLLVIRWIKQGLLENRRYAVCFIRIVITSLFVLWCSPC